MVWIAGATTLASLTGMGVVNTLTKEVTIVVDGRATTGRVSAETVGQALVDQGVDLGVHDVVYPPADTVVRDRMQITVSYGRQVQVKVDGAMMSFWTTSATVNGVLAALGLTDPNVQVSVDPTTPVTDEGLAISVSVPRQVELRADQATTTFETTVGTVGDMLTARGLTLGPDDIVTPALDTPITDFMTVAIQRGVITQETTTAEIPFTVTKQDDATLPVGQVKVKTAGVNGTKQQVWQVVTVDGVEQSRTLVSETVTKAPVDEVDRVGTKPPTAPAKPAATTTSGGDATPPPAAPAVPAGSAQDIARSLLPDFGFGDDQFGCLVNLWNHESGWRVNAQNRSSGAYGIPQALPGSKMAAYGSDWRTNPATQIKWGLSYIKNRYGTPCGAWGHFQSTNWY